MPDQILLKPVELNEAEWRVMEAHTLLGAQMIGGVANFLHGKKRQVVRSITSAGTAPGIPTRSSERRSRSARIFAVADALDAITNHRPYRAARSWRDCRREIVAQKGTQFDPTVVEAFQDREYARCTRSAASSSRPRRRGLCSVTAKSSSPAAVRVSGICVTEALSLVRRDGE